MGTDLPSTVKSVVAFLSALLAAGVMAEPEFRPRQVVKPFPAITNPDHAVGKDAARFVRDDELVLGVVVGREARAYPINMLTNPTREIINDKLGGRPIAATW